MTQFFRFCSRKPSKTNNKQNKATEMMARYDDAPQRCPHSFPRSQLSQSLPCGKKSTNRVLHIAPPNGSVKGNGSSAVCRYVTYPATLCNLHFHLHHTTPSRRAAIISMLCGGFIKLLNMRSCKSCLGCSPPRVCHPSNCFIQLNKLI